MKEDLSERLIFNAHKIVQIARECYQKQDKLNDAEFNEGLARIESTERYLSMILKRIE